VEPEIGIGGLFINPVFNEFSACPDSHRFPACRTTDAQSAQDPGQGSARQPEPSATNEPTGQPTSKGEGNAESEPRRADHRHHNPLEPPALLAPPLPQRSGDHPVEALIR